MMDLSNDLAQFLNKHKQLIREGCWNKLYSYQRTTEITPYQLSAVLIQAEPQLPQLLKAIGPTYFSEVTIPGEELLIQNKSLIDWEAFYQANLPSQVTLENIRYVGMEAFGQSSFDRLILIGEVGLEEAVFKGCSLVEADLTKFSGIELPYATFRNCQQLRIVQLPEQLIEIDAAVFENCPNLRYLNIPKDLETIKSAAPFPEDKSIQEVTTTKTAQQLRRVRGIREFVANYCIEKAIIRCVDGVMRVSELIN